MKEIKQKSAFLKMTRSGFIKKSLFAVGASIFPISCDKNDPPIPLNPYAKVYLVKNGTVSENIEKLLELLGGITKYINATDVVILKCNGQWPNQGYTNTECIKHVILSIPSIPGFSGEVLICDNIQGVPDDTNRGFLASVENRKNNWADHNWNSLAAEFQSNGRPVATYRWQNVYVGEGITGPTDGTGWVRDFFSFHEMPVYLSYPIFASPITPGRIIDMKRGVWENCAYTGRRVRTIFMPTLNNHGNGREDYAGITSAIKCFFGATEILADEDGTIIHNGEKVYHIHSVSYSRNKSYYAGELAARFIKTMYSPVLYITCAIWSGYESRTGKAIETKTVLACENPASLDYVACKHVISPHASWLNPDKDNNTRKQILGCVDNGIGTIEPDNFEIISYDFM